MGQAFSGLFLMGGAFFPRGAVEGLGNRFPDAPQEIHPLHDRALENQPMLGGILFFRLFLCHNQK